MTSSVKPIVKTQFPFEIFNHNLKSNNPFISNTVMNIQLTKQNNKYFERKKDNILRINELLL